VIGAVCDVDVDIGVVTYETRDLTVELLQRLLENATDVRVRLLVHDNASTDGTAAAIRASVPAADVEVCDSNLGFAAGMNRLLARSTAPWFLALNSDAWPEPGAIRRLVEVGEAEPRAAAIAPRIERPDGVLEHSTYPFPTLEVAAINALGGYRRLWPRRSRRLALVGAWDHDEPREVDWAVGAALLMRRSALDAIGGFDESFFMYVEDLEWCWRAGEAGWSIRFEPSAVVRHVGNATGSRIYGAARTRAHVHNFYRFYRRTHGRAATSVFRALALGGYGRLYLLARLRRDQGARVEWAAYIRAHASRVAAGDGPPSQTQAVS
jgi:GT2 family glycosyltransferase